VDVVATTTLVTALPSKEKNRSLFFLATLDGSVDVRARFVSHSHPQSPASPHTPNHRFVSILNLVFDHPFLITFPYHVPHLIPIPCVLVICSTCWQQILGIACVGQGGGRCRGGRAHERGWRHFGRKLKLEIGGWNTSNKHTPKKNT
jgi:hypothetical protein